MVCSFRSVFEYCFFVAASVNTVVLTLFEIANQHHLNFSCKPQVISLESKHQVITNVIDTRLVFKRSLCHIFSQIKFPTQVNSSTYERCLLLQLIDFIMLSGSEEIKQHTAKSKVKIRFRIIIVY